jgi:hypothetical protein
LVDPCVDLFVDFVECGLEGCIGGAEVGKRGGQSRTQQSVVGAGMPMSETGSGADIISLPRACPLGAKTVISTGVRSRF